MLVAALLWYNRFRKDLENEEFVFNPYDACVANRTINGRQHTIRFHVDDLMSSHVDPQVNDQFQDWMNAKYGNFGAVTCKRGKVHDYLGMTFDSLNPEKVKVDMKDYMAGMVDNFSMKFTAKDIVHDAASGELWAEGDATELDQKRREEFHTMVAKGLFACKQARPDIHLMISHLCT
jgi:hypothetical protein